MTNTRIMVQVLEARYQGDYRVWVRFDDGVEGEVDLSAELEGEVFSPLRDRKYFAKFVVDETLTWPYGADFAPEFLHAACTGSGEPPQSAGRA